MAPDAEVLATQFFGAVQAATTSTERAAQERLNIVGVSDLGTCRELVRFMLTNTEPTDDPDKWAAFIGTAVGDAVEAAVADGTGWRRQVTVEVNLPSGIVIPGHIDLLAEAENGIVDVKTTGSMQVVRREGPTQQQQFQRHLYCYGAIQEGLIPEDEAWVANVWFDRTGETSVPFVDVEPFRMDQVVAADDWLTDVLYAIRVGERASKDKPISFCQKACQFFSLCRGRDDVQPGLIEDPELLAAVSAYLDGQDMESEGARVKRAARRILEGVNGTTGTHVVTTTFVDGVDVAGFYRRPYQRLDVRPVSAANRRRGF